MKKILIFILILIQILFTARLVSAEYTYPADLVPGNRSYLFVNGRLSFNISNKGGSDINSPFIIRFQWYKTGSETLGQAKDYSYPGLKRGETKRIDTNSISDQSLVNYIINPPDGAWSLLIKLDAGGAIQEQYENDNELWTYMNIDGDRDLAAESLDYENGRATFTIKNNSQRILNGIGYRLEWVGADNTVLNYAEHRIGVGANSSVTVNSDNVSSYESTQRIVNMLAVPASGATKLVLKIDQTDQFVESNEDNNKAEKSVPLQQSDLAIESPAIILDGTRFTHRVTFVLRNKGNAPVRFPISVKFTWYKPQGEEGLTRYFPIPDMLGRGLFAPGQTYNFDSEISNTQIREMISAPSSSYSKLKITADPDNVSRDSDQSNNSAELNKPLPDFAFENIVLDEDNNLKFTIKNKGTGTAFNSLNTLVTVSLNWENTNFSHTLNFSLHAPGSSNSVDTTRSSGDLWQFMNRRPEDRRSKLIVNIDKANTFAESDKNNNNASLESQVLDLAVTDALFTPQNLTFKVKNFGNKNTTREFPVKLRRFDVEGNQWSTSVNISNLSAGATRSFNSNDYQNLRNLVDNAIETNSRIEIEVTAVSDQDIDESNNKTEVSLSLSNDNRTDDSVVETTSGISGAFGFVKNLGGAISRILEAPRNFFRRTDTNVSPQISISPAVDANVEQRVITPTIKIDRSLIPSPAPTKKLYRIPSPTPKISIKLNSLSPTPVKIRLISPTPTKKLFRIPSPTPIKIRLISPTPTQKVYRISSPTPTTKLYRISSPTPTPKVIKSIISPTKSEKRINPTKFLLPTLRPTRVPTSTPTPRPTKTPTPIPTQRPIKQIKQKKTVNEKSVLGVSTSLSMGPLGILNYWWRWK